MLFFSEDKLLHSFINEVEFVSLNNIRNVGECVKWISEFGNLITILFFFFSHFTPIKI